MSIFKRRARIPKKETTAEKKKRQSASHVFGLNRTQRKQWEFLMQVLRTLGNCFGALFALLSLYFSYQIFMHTVMAQ